MPPSCFIWCYFCCWCCPVIEMKKAAFDETISLGDTTRWSAQLSYEKIGEKTDFDLKKFHLLARIDATHSNHWAMTPQMIAYTLKWVIVLKVTPALRAAHFWMLPSTSWWKKYVPSCSRVGFIATLSFLFLFFFTLFACTVQPLLVDLSKFCRAISELCRQRRSVNEMCHLVAMLFVLLMTDDDTTMLLPLVLPVPVPVPIPLCVNE